MIDLVLYSILIFLIISAIAVVILKDIVSSIIAFSTFSIILTILFILLNAPDVAIAEAVIGAGFITSIFVVTVSKTMGGKK